MGKSGVVGEGIHLQGKAQKRIHLVPLGEWFRGEQLIRITPEMVATMRVNFAKRGIPAVIDYDHATLRPMPAPAAAWITQVEDDAKGLWGEVSWTARAVQQIEAPGAPEYAFISPVIFWDSIDRKTGKPSGAELHSAGLTNDPFFHELQPVMGSTVAGEDLDIVKLTRQPTQNEGAHAGNTQNEGVMKNLLIAVFTLLGLQENTPEEVATARVTELLDGEKSSKDAKGALVAHFGLATDDGWDKVLVAAREMKGRAQKATTAAASAAEEALKSQAATARMEAEKLVASYPTKVSPAMRAECTRMALEDPARFQAFMATMPDVLPGGPLTQPTRLGSGAFTDAELAAFSQLGLAAEDVKKFAG